MNEVISGDLGLVVAVVGNLEWKEVIVRNYGLDEVIGGNHGFSEVIIGSWSNPRTDTPPDLYVFCTI